MKQFRVTMNTNKDGLGLISLITVFASGPVDACLTAETKSYDYAIKAVEIVDIHKTDSF